jgi:sialic acid synthase SpsE
VTAVEQKLKNSLRRTIFAIKNKNTGEKITIDNVDILRAAEAGIGLDPKEYHKILGKKVVRDIKAFDLINKISLDQ